MKTLKMKDKVCGWTTQINHYKTDDSFELRQFDNEGVNRRIYLKHSEGEKIFMFLHKIFGK